MLWCYTRSGEDSAWCTVGERTVLLCTVAERTVLWCIVSERTVLQYTCSGENSAPLQMEWNMDTPMLFELEELVEGTVLCYSTCSRDWSSICSSVNFIGVPSCPLSKLSQFLLLQCQSHWSPFCSKSHRVQCSAAPHIAETGVLSPPVSILLEFLLLHSQFYQSSFFFGLNFIRAPSSPVSILSQFLLLHCQFYLSPSCSKCQRVQCSAALHIAKTGVLSPPVSILLEFLLLCSQFYRSSFFSALNFITVPSSPVSILFESLLLKCQRVQCSAAPHIAETRVLSPLVSILLELLLLQSQFYWSSFFSTLNFIGAPSSPL